MIFLYVFLRAFFRGVGYIIIAPFWLFWKVFWDWPRRIIRRM